MDVTTGLLGLSTCLGSVVSQEVIESGIPLPDGRDVSEVLHIYARVSIESSVCAADGVRVSGKILLCCVCRSMVDEVYGFHAQSTFTHVLQVEGVCEGQSAQVRAQVVECRGEPDTLRLKLHIVLELAAFVSAPVTTPFVTDISGGSCVEKRMTTLPVRRSMQLAEATLRLAEEADANGVLRVLLCYGEAQTTSLAFTGASNCEAAGKLTVNLLVETEDHEVRTQLIALPFTCSFDVPYQTQTWAECTVESLSAVAADLSFGVIDAEATVRVRLFCAETSESAVLVDAYATDTPLTCSTASFDRLCFAGCEQKTCTVTESVKIPAPLPDAMRAVFATAMPFVTGLFSSDGRLSADVMLLIGVLYRSDEGKIYGFTEEVPVQIAFDAAFTPDAQVFLRTLSVTASGSGRMLELSAALYATAQLYETIQTTLVSEVLTEGAPCPYSGILIYCADAGESLWEVGKRFAVPMSALQQWNGDLAEPLACGQAVVLFK